MNILVACEFSGVVRDAFRNAGHEAWSCDLIELDDLPPGVSAGEYPNYHLTGDVRWFLKDFGAVTKWDMLIGFPPCTYLCNSGVRWLYKNGKGRVRDKERWVRMYDAARLFRQLWCADIKHICLENPIMHKHARSRIGPKYTQIVHPWQFGHGETKATCLWLKNLPPLEPTDIVEGRAANVHRAPPSPHRAMQRSLTFSGIATAMAEQWSNLR